MISNPVTPNFIAYQTVGSKKQVGLALDEKEQ